MDISLLNVRITLQKATASIDDIGNHLHVWVDYYDCFATVSGEGGREKISAGNMQINAEIAFTVRYCAALSDIDTVLFRVVFKGDIYDIIGIDHMNYKRKTLKIKCVHAR